MSKIISSVLWGLLYFSLVMLGIITPTITSYFITVIIILCYAILEVGPRWFQISCWILGLFHLARFILVYLDNL